jgi:putative transposase
VRAGLVEDPANYRWCGYASAMADRPRAKDGLRQIFGASSDQPWEEVIASYRLILFGLSAGAGADKGRLSRAQVLEIVENGGRVSRADLLRCRVRYFSGAAVLGGADFVQAWFERNRAQLSPTRQTGPRRMRGMEGDLTVLRDLRQGVFG